MSYPSYLIHFNKNHSSKDGRFISGDGDGDGQVSDNANRSKRNKNLASGSKQAKTSITSSSSKKSTAKRVKKVVNKNKDLTLNDVTRYLEKTNSRIQTHRAVKKRWGSDAAWAVTNFQYEMDDFVNMLSR